MNHCNNYSMCVSLFCGYQTQSATCQHAVHDASEPNVLAVRDVKLRQGFTLEAAHLIRATIGTPGDVRRQRSWLLV